MYPIPRKYSPISLLVSIAVSVVRQRRAEAHQGRRSDAEGVCCLDFVDHLAELRDRFDDLSLHQLRPSEADATLKGLRRVADRLGEIKPFFSCGAGLDRIARH